jgi:hypothetical protein
MLRILLRHMRPFFGANLADIEALTRGERLLGRAGNANAPPLPAAVLAAW